MSSTRDVIIPAEGFSTGIGYYVSGMEEVREQLREVIAEMPSERLGCCAIPGAHSIAGLVLHIGEAEWYWMQMVINGRKLTVADKESAFWDVLESPDSFAARNYSAAFCIEQITEIREQTRELLATFNDDDLDRIFTRLKRGVKTEHSLRWILHHLIDHEAQHKGQILMLKRFLPNQT